MKIVDPGGEKLDGFLFSRVTKAGSRGDTQALLNKIERIDAFQPPFPCWASSMHEMVRQRGIESRGLPAPSGTNNLRKTET